MDCPIGVAPVAGRYAVRLLPRGIHRKGDEGSLDWCGRPPLHVDAARELDDRRAPEPMPSTPLSATGLDGIRTAAPCQPAAASFLEPDFFGYSLAGQCPKIFHNCAVDGCV